MLYINNVLRPCIICSNVIKDKDAYICQECWDDFKGKSEPAENCASNEHLEDAPRYDDICSDVIAEILEDRANDISLDVDEEPSFHISKE